MPARKSDELSPLFITSIATIPHDGTFRAETIDTQTAGELLASAISEQRAVNSVTRRNCADVLEKIAGVRIPTNALRISEHQSIDMPVGSKMICAVLNARGKRKVQEIRNAALSPADYDFVLVTRTK